MKFHDKLQLLRRERNLSQEALAEMLGVSRQAVSKWESGQAYPEIENLVTLSHIFNVTMDSLVKDGPIQYNPGSEGTNAGFHDRRVGRVHYEYKSERTLFGLPLVHVNVGLGFYSAKGILAVGMISRGLLSFGLLSIGLLAVGPLALGLIGLGAISLGLLLAIGAIAIGIFAVGSIAIGIFALGALSLGMFSTGALAVASHVAVGSHAYGHIAAGSEVAEGARVFLSTTDNLSGIKAVEVQDAIRQEFPWVWEWAVRLATFSLR
ncbi:MAG: helix-turn-helix domain-containing protein [Oscillospiraceae bacterium]|nr:helix-turn-helix domain-containing protein [Oscillospiraceae bacterium]